MSDVESIGTCTFLADNEFSKYLIYLNVKNLVVVGTDITSVMAGINNGVYTKLKKGAPLLILMQCACHSMQLVMSYAASECLPRTLEFLIVEGHKWFSN